MDENKRYLGRLPFWRSECIRLPGETLVWAGVPAMIVSHNGSLLYVLEEVVSQTALFAVKVDLGPKRPEFRDHGWRRPP